MVEGPDRATLEAVVRSMAEAARTDMGVSE
jgi:hypothetical protein